MLIVKQCSRMPMGMQTVEIIPNSLHEEWTNALNVAHELRRSASTEIGKERSLKWIMWMPQGLFHAPTREGKKVIRQYKEIARRFVLWRQRDMEALIKT